jgi:cytochrome c553
MRNLVLGALALAVVGACSQPNATAPLTGEALVARGEYLVSNVALCGDCHTPFAPETGPDLSRRLQGAPTLMTPSVEIPWATAAPPIAGIPPHFTEEQFIAFLQTGVRPDGSQPRPPMPPYRLNEEDARAVAAYITSLPAAPSAPAQP